LQLAILLATDVKKYSGAWNFGPVNADNLPVLHIAKKIVATWGKGEINLQVDPNAVHEANLLQLDISKVINELKWKPKMDTEKAIERTIAWYKFFYEGKKTAIALMEEDISYYQSL